MKEAEWGGEGEEGRRKVEKEQVYKCVDVSLLFAVYEDLFLCRFTRFIM